MILDTWVQGKIKIHPELQGQLYFSNDSPTSLMLNQDDFNKFLPQMTKMREYYKKRSKPKISFPLFHSHIYIPDNNGTNPRQIPIKCQVLSVDKVHQPRDIPTNKPNKTFHEKGLFINNVN